MRYLRHWICMFHIFTAYALCNSNLFTALCKRINTPLFTTNIKAEVHLREIVQFRRHFQEKKDLHIFIKFAWQILTTSSTRQQSHTREHTHTSTHTRAHTHTHKNTTPHHSCDSLSLTRTHTRRAKLHIWAVNSKYRYSRWFRSARLSEQSQNYLLS